LEKSLDQGVGGSVREEPGNLAPEIKEAPEIMRSCLKDSGANTKDSPLPWRTVCHQKNSE
jgi:hypothetical protein